MCVYMCLQDNSLISLCVCENAYCSVLHKLILAHRLWAPMRKKYFCMCSEMSCANSNANSISILSSSPSGFSKWYRRNSIVPFSGFLKYNIICRVGTNRIHINDLLHYNLLFSILFIHLSIGGLESNLPIPAIFQLLDHVRKVVFRKVCVSWIFYLWAIVCGLGRDNSPWEP